MLRAKKSLGQNFLKNEGVLAKIASAGDLSSKDTVLEIGPGHGALTKHLLASGATVIAIEKDSTLADELQTTFAKEIKNKKFFLTHGDALDIDLDILFAHYPLKTKSYKLVANIPYNITGAFFRMYLSAINAPTDMVVLIQEEVADRIIARNPSTSLRAGKESILSIAIKAYGTPEKLFKVSPGSFVPAPKVTSAVIHIHNISKTNFKKADEKLFFEILRAGFAHKRKMLAGNLSELFSKEVIARVFMEAKLPIKTRAEDLPLATWLLLVQLFSK